MLGKYSSLDIANIIIKISLHNNKPLTQMHVNKLLYFANGTYLLANKNPLIQEKFVALEYGPVERKLYNVLKFYGRNIIPTPIKLPEQEVKISDVVINLLKKEYNTFKDFTGMQLSALTHKKNGAWDKTNKYNEIADNDIYEEFKTLWKIQNVESFKEVI